MQEQQRDVLTRTYTAGQAARVAGLPYHDVNYWAKTEFIAPSVRAADGSKSCRVYNFRDLVALDIARCMRDAGFNLRGIQRFANYIQREARMDMRSNVFVMLATSGSVLEVEGVDNLESTIGHFPDGYIFFFVALSRVVPNVASKARELKQPTRGKASAVV